jgi:hypothetical protein
MIRENLKRILLSIVFCVAATACAQPKHYQLADLTIQDLPVRGAFWHVSADGKGAQTYLTVEDFAKVGSIDQSLVHTPQIASSRFTSKEETLGMADAC